MVIGFAAGVIAALAVGLKYRFGYDGSLDVMTVHGIGGITGLLATGLLAVRRRQQIPVRDAAASTTAQRQAPATVCRLSRA